MEISIIIPNLHSPIIDQTIQSILDQKTQYTYEIIIVGQDKYKLINQFINEKVQFFETVKPTPPGIARNIGVENSSGSYIFFIDSDCVASPHWVDLHMELHKQHQNPIVVGGGVAFSSDRYLELTDNIATFHENMVHIKQQKKELLPSLNLSLPKNLWHQIGGFDPYYPYPAGEDAEFTTRIFLNCNCLYFIPQAFVFHKPNRQKFKDIFIHAFRFGMFSIKGNKKYQKQLKIPLLLKNKTLSIIFSPILSFYVIWKIMCYERLPIKYWHTLPLIFILKIIWCFGFAYAPNNSSRI